MSHSLALGIHLPVVSLMYSVVVAERHLACISYHHQLKAPLLATSISHCINLSRPIFQATLRSERENYEREFEYYDVTLLVHTHARSWIIYSFKSGIDFSTTVRITSQLTEGSMTKTEKETDAQQFSSVHLYDKIYRWHQDQ